MTEQQANARRVARDRREGRVHMTHAAGLCGGMAGLCPACSKDEHAWLSEWANSKPAPNPGERIGDYWRRIGGRFADNWLGVAAEKYRQAGIAITY